MSRSHARAVLATTAASWFPTSAFGYSAGEGPRAMPSHADAALETRLVRVRGRVQGVGYRHACVQYARAHGVTGWVRNRMDDSVEAMLQGTPQQVAQMCRWMRDDMPAALVEAMEVADVAPPFPRFDRFEQRPTA